MGKTSVLVFFVNGKKVSCCTVVVVFEGKFACKILQVVEDRADPEWTLLYYLRVKCILYYKNMQSS